MRVYVALLRAAVFVGAITWATTPAAVGQSWGTVTGQVTDAETGGPVPAVSVVVDGTDFGTATEADGTYTVRLPAASYDLRFSSVGFDAAVRQVAVRAGETTTAYVLLLPSTYEMDELTVEETAIPSNPGAYDLSPREMLDVPSPFKGFQSLAVLPGVAVNNELSNQYSVRGGGFNENLIFINGFEVHMPFRPRQGEQEGLGLLNPELVDRLTLYTGGFPARYGGKLSSALETRYDRPDGEPMRGSASLSLLDASLTNRGSVNGGRFGWNVGLRKARARHFFSTQELEGTYQPDYTDVQGLLAYRIAPGHDVLALGIYADHTFRLQPQSRKTYFGIVSPSPGGASDLRSFWIRYDGTENDGYRTSFTGVRLSNRLSPAIRTEHDLAYFGTVEHERFDIGGTAIIFRVDPAAGNPNTGTGHLPIGNASQAEFADNRVEVDSWTARGRYTFFRGDHVLEGGWHVRGLSFADRIDERTALAGKNADGERVRIVVDSLSDAARLSAVQSGFYLQDDLSVGDISVAAGLRADHFSFNDEWTVAPRVSARYGASDQLSLTAGWGYYYQAPTYRELRGRPEPGESIRGSLNRDIRSQRAIQYAVGGEYFIPSRRLYLRAEAYYKHLDPLISYDIQNVRVTYSGENDSEGRAYGLDVRLRGELVPGLESWVNYSYLDAVERFLPAYRTEETNGTIPRPSDQRHTVSLFVQDYVPRDPTWKVHLRALFGSGLPYTPPVPGQQVGAFVSQVPGDRHSARYPEYRRVDMGVTKGIEFEDLLELELTAEVLNVFDMTNTVAYTWVPNGSGIWERIPTRLTPRTFNVRLRLTY
ncbi:MAG: TonB-dependent receptor [Rhodothermales bacterium]